MGARPAPAPTALQALVRITKVIGSGRSLETVFDAVADELRALLPYDRCSVALLDPEGETVSVSSHRGRFAEPFGVGRRPIAGTVAGWVIEHSAPLIHEIGPEDRFLEDDTRRRFGIVQLAAVPLLIDGVPVGAFGLSSTTAGAYGPDDLWLLETVADHLALAIAATNLRRDAERRATRAQYLAETATAFASTLDLDLTLRAAVHRAADVLGDMNAIFLVDEASGNLRLRELSHPDPEWEELTRRKERESPPTPESPVLGPPLRGEPLLVTKLTLDRVSAGMRDFVRQLGVRSAVAVPLIAGGRVIGVLCSWWTGWPGRPPERRRDAGPDDLGLAQELAAQVAAAIEQARLYAAAQQAIAARDEFLSVAAHELRTPLTTLRGRAQLLERRLGGAVAPAERDAFRVMLRQLDRLGRMINDLLDLSRIDAGRLVLVPEPCDLVALAEAAAGEHRTQGAQIEVVADEEAIVGYWDGWRLEQVLANLLGNAIRFSPVGEPITLRVGRRDGEAVLSIVDRGAGIEAGELERIFERFYRGRWTERAGFGLGLALCRQIVADHSGRLWAESAGPGRGATFTMALPMTEALGVRR
jgi:signal transduction histidine kinase